MRESGDDRPSPLAAALKTCQRHFAFAAGFSALVNLLYLAPTIFMLQVYDRVLPARSDTTLVFLVVVLVLAIATLALLDAVRGRLMTRASIGLDRALSTAILDASLARPDGSRDMLSRQALREFDILRQTLTGPVLLALFDAPWAPIFILVCALIHPLLGAIALVGAGVIVALAWLTERATRDRLRRANEAAGVAYVNQEVSTSNADTVRALGMRRALVGRHIQEREVAGRLQAEASFSASGFTAATRFVRIFLQSVALAAGAFLAIHQLISPGAVFAASLLTSRALAPIEQLIGAWRSFAQGRTAYKNVGDLLKAQAERRSPTALPLPTGALTLETLTVLNAARDGILTDISFEIAAGETIGVIGPSGAGKSTLLRAIAGALAPDRGAIRLDGADRGDWDADEIGALMGFMPQESVIFAGSVRDNISRFEPAATDAERRAIDDRVVTAAKMAEAHELILQLPGGYDATVGWRSRSLSAGQAQRISLARALYGDPAIVLLDEPNAHLDLEGETALVRTLQKLKAAKVTVLIAAHRTGIVSAIDKLMVLREGRLSMFGPRDEILAKTGRPPLRTATSSNVTVIGGRT